jgi:peptidoglycan/LPS O-acetylase OafA/YrhL
MERKEVLPLTGLRGVAAIWVLAMHIRNLSGHVYPAAKDELSWIANAGYLGVDIFFALSGFVLAYSYPSLSRSEYLPFIWKRLARIYPIHLATLALTGLTAVALGDRFASSSLQSVEGLVSSLLLTHGWAYPIRGTWNVPSWSISVEFAAYLLFPMLAFVAHRIRSPLACLVGIGALYYALHILTSQGAYATTMPYGMPRIAAGFTAGVLLHRFYALKGAIPSTLITTVCVVCFAGASAYDRIYNYNASINYLPALSCVLIYCLLSPGKVTSALSTRTMVYLGRISFALYMVHGVFIRIAHSLIPVKLQDPVTGWSLLLAVVAASFASAALLYRYVEEPARRRMVELFSPKSSQQRIDTVTP